MNTKTLMQAYEKTFTKKEAAITDNVAKMKGLSKDSVMARLQELLYKAEKHLSNTNGAIFDRTGTILSSADEPLRAVQSNRLGRVNKVQGMLGKRANYLKRFKYIAKLIK